MRCAVVALALIAGCDDITAQQQADELAAAQQAIVGGTIDFAADAVVAILPRRSSCEPQASYPIACSGTLIASDVVLTAAHCLYPDAGDGTLEVYVGPRVGDADGRFVVIDHAVRHPQFDDATHAFDLGIVHLVEPIAVTPIALPTTTLDATAVGASARIVGYGVTAAGEIADGVRREGTMQITAVDVATFTAAPQPSNSCGGDSGGPVFVATPAGEQLFGVTSSGDPTCVAKAIDARIDVALADFIEPYLAEPPAHAPPSGGDCLMPPGDGGCAVGGGSAWIALALIGCRRRRSAYRAEAESTRGCASHEHVR